VGEPMDSSVSPRFLCCRFINYSSKELSRNNLRMRRRSVDLMRSKKPGQIELKVQHGYCTDFNEFPGRC
jgi:hypothetical protein